MDAKLAEIQRNIDSTEAAIQAGGVSQAQIDVWNSQLADFNVQKTSRMAELQDIANREQAQTEAVNSIELPMDFNELFDNSQANDVIIEVVKEFQTKAYADHNAEVAKINADWTNKLQARTDTAANQLTQLQARLDSELLQAQEDAKAFADLEQSYVQCLNDRKDAESKRDAAAAEIIRLNSHIDDLQLQLANAPAPKAAIEIGSSDRLAELAAKAKESNADKMARALARWNTDHADQAIEIPKELPLISEEPAPLEVPAATPDDFRQASETEESSNVVQSGTDAAQQTSGENAEPTVKAESAVTRAEFDAAIARITALESGNGQIAA